MTEAEKLAALDRAATQGVPVTGNDWLRQFSDDRQLADVLLALYRANQLVLIGPDAVERVHEAMTHADTDNVITPEDAAILTAAALAALGVK